MQIVLVIAAALVFVAVVVLVVANPKMAKRRAVALDATTAALGASTPICRDDDANCFGVEVGDAKPRHYGQGSAAVTDEEFIFSAVVSGETIAVPLETITLVEVETSHIIKSATTLVMKLTWDDPTEGESTGRWKLEELEAFVAALGGTVSPATDTDAETDTDTDSGV